ncbi:hypothetical protein [Enterocloster bolteae]|nr:hypothetical protein [Enterocloster bolteae]
MNYASPGVGKDIAVSDGINVSGDFITTKGILEKCFSTHTNI